MDIANNHEYLKWETRRDVQEHDLTHTFMETKPKFAYNLQSIPVLFGITPHNGLSADLPCAYTLNSCATKCQEEKQSSVSPCIRWMSHITRKGVKQLGFFFLFFNCFGSARTELRAGSGTGWRDRHPSISREEPWFEKTKWKLLNGWSEEGARSQNSVRYSQLPFRQGYLQGRQQDWGYDNQDGR